MRRDLQAFICGEFTRPFIWGKSDCAAMADRWVHKVAGFSPLDRYGRRHADEREARAWMAEPGGYAACTKAVMRAAGLKRTVDPQAGDIGLVQLLGRVAVAIACGDGQWISRDEDGFFSGTAERVIAAWQVPLPEGDACHR